MSNIYEKHTIEVTARVSSTATTDIREESVELWTGENAPSQENVLGAKIDATHKYPDTQSSIEDRPNNGVMVALKTVELDNEARITRATMNGGVIIKREVVGVFSLVDESQDS